ncbi:MAG: M20 family metallopeptidase [Defluviitaleaceae bacterium]|nr:M20 family metallopeptidase [Defluviitaleaceae bacterium]
MDNFKQSIIDAVDGITFDLITLSRSIHTTPEIAFEERHACKVLTEFLAGHGFDVQTGYGGHETAFLAEHALGDGSGPTVAFIAEYDALPEIGHACGHNLIAIMAAGAAVGLLSAASKIPTGRILCIGTPAEEGLGGKISMIENGAFSGVDFALMVHPSGRNLINRTSTALQHWYVTFTGKNAHSSNPQSGINALSAVIQTFNNIDYLRPIMPLTANVHGIVTKGGMAANIITETAAAEFTTRAKDMESLNFVNDCVTRAIRAAEVLTGATAQVKREPCYAEMNSNRAISAAFAKNMADLGIEMIDADNNGKYGSSDIGNVSQVLPTIHPYLDIKPEGNAHSVAFTASSVSDYAHSISIKGAQGLAMTGFDIMTNESLRKEINYEFNKNVKLMLDESNSF